ncbi:L-ascorbate metabolism protein UlaG (beta-lactamase superfamily) [Nocardia tenerifensis]|uniref:L-ascorbate metabolism protein UlaG (Beta-lactamase superfamily) n=1 Tax=Nocardia tenerifensis TaxID=228006 RepID=A0A318K739_9NOCA|nr:MBL fold metallo-hydrolase [Nocardia tenerifensis]PXX65492.1 L-ascorbate metabolism protein UlaG (beta-lactamase superfamily) [Nocardia tenerifensis]
MRIRRLGWAGVEIEFDGATLVIDAVQDSELLRGALPEDALRAPRRPNAALAALVTHLHTDHADPSALRRILSADGVVLRPAPMAGAAEDVVWTAEAESAFAASGLTTRVVTEWETTTIGPFEVTAVPAVDGLGDPQVNWVVGAGGQRIFHGGDTIFHGLWWLIARRCGPIDAAFLPINGAAVRLPHLRPASPLPAVLTPEQAAMAGHILGARTIVPIHFGLDIPPYYVEVDESLTKFRAAAAELGVDVTVLAPGEERELAAHRVG